MSKPITLFQQWNEQDSLSPRRRQSAWQPSSLPASSASALPGTFSQNNRLPGLSLEKRGVGLLHAWEPGKVLVAEKTTQNEPTAT